MSRPLIVGIVSSLAGATLLSACVMVPAEPPRRVVYAPAPPVVAMPAPVYVAPAPPPAPYVEVRPIMPFVGAVWIAGYWAWNAGRHIWIGGRWEAPRPGYRWEPHHWEPEGDRWHLRGGEWRRE